MESEIKKNDTRETHSPNKTRTKLVLCVSFSLYLHSASPKKTYIPSFMAQVLDRLEIDFFFPSIFLHTHIFDGLSEKNGNIFAKHNDKTFGTGTKTMPLQKPNHIIFV